MNSTKLIKKTRKVIDLKTKREIIALAEQGLPHRIIANNFDLGRSTVTKILLSKTKIMENDLGAPSNSVKRIRGSKLGILENSVVRWCIGKCDSPPSEHTYHTNFDNKEGPTKVKEGINQEDILQKANELAKELGIDSFTASYTWLKKLKDRFKLDFNIDNSKLVSENKENRNSFNDKLSIAAPILKSNVPSQIPSPLSLPTNQYIPYFNFDQFTHTTFQNNLSPNDPCMVYNSDSSQLSPTYFGSFNNHPFLYSYSSSSIFPNSIGSEFYSFIPF